MGTRISFLGTKNNFQGVTKKFMGNLKICGQLQKCLGTSIMFLGILNNYAGHIYNFRTFLIKMGSENISGAMKYFSGSIHMLWIISPHGPPYCMSTTAPPHIHRDTSSPFFFILVLFYITNQFSTSRITPRAPAHIHHGTSLLLLVLLYFTNHLSRGVPASKKKTQGQFFC